MDRRLAIASGCSLWLLLAVFAPPAAAVDAGEDHEDSDGESGTESEQDDSGGDYGENPGSGGSPESSGADSAPSSNPGGHQNGDVEQARLAVASKDAVPLVKVLDKFHQSGNYTVIDVRLSRSNDTFLYVIKYIDDAGRVRKAYFDARTATLVK